MTSIIDRVELVRVARCLAAAAGGARLRLAGLDTIPLVEHVADVAQTTGLATLRTLDAIHLASALSVRDELIAFCSYDRRLLDAAGDAGLRPRHVSGQPSRRQFGAELQSAEHAVDAARPVVGTIPA